MLDAHAAYHICATSLYIPFFEQIYHVVNMFPALHCNMGINADRLHQGWHTLVLLLSIMCARLLWQDKPCPAHTYLIMSCTALVLLCCFFVVVAVIIIIIIIVINIVSNILVITIIVICIVVISTVIIITIIIIIIIIVITIVITILVLFIMCACACRHQQGATQRWF